jgi:DNA sulfur modification protein DndE
MIEVVRVSEKGKTQLIMLKRKTGVPNWNILCRWAFCLSLAEPTVPPDEHIVADSSIEMSWKTFSGGNEDLYWALLVLRTKRDGIPLESAALAKYFRLHLHRGISYLNGHPLVKGIDGFARLVAASQTKDAA